MRRFLEFSIGVVYLIVAFCLVSCGEPAPEIKRESAQRLSNVNMEWEFRSVILKLQKIKSPVAKIKDAKIEVYDLLGNLLRNKPVGTVPSQEQGRMFYMADSANPIVSETKFLMLRWSVIYEISGSSDTETGRAVVECKTQDTPTLLVKCDDPGVTGKCVRWSDP